MDLIICDQSNHEYCNKATMYKYLLMIPTIPICLIKSYTKLSYVSLGGIACATLGSLLLIAYCSIKLAEDQYIHEEVKTFDAG